MDGIEAVVDIIDHRPVHNSSSTAAKTVVGQGGSEAGARNASQLVSGIPGVRRRSAGVGEGGQIAVEIVGLGSGPKGRLLIIGVVARRGQRWRDIGPAKRAAGIDAIARCVVCVCEGPQRRRAFFIGHSREFGGAEA